MDNDPEIGKGQLDPAPTTTPGTERISSEEQNVVISPQELPTTLEIAKHGVRDFERVIPKIPAELREFFCSPEVARCYIGTNPEFGGTVGSSLWDIPQDKIEELNAILASVCPDIIIISHTPEAGTNGKISIRRSLVNLRAASRVIQSRHFPDEARRNPREWLIAHTEDWSIGATSWEEHDELNNRTGLLSGYYSKSVEGFYRYHWLRRKLDTSSVTEEEIDFIKAYDSLLRVPKTEEDNQRMLALVQRMSPRISIEDAELFINKRLIEDKAVGAYVGFSGDEDTEYVLQLHEIYEQSGIEQVAMKAKLTL